MINSLVQCQLSYINTIDPNFVGGTTAIAMVRSACISCAACSGADVKCVHRRRRSFAARGRRRRRLPQSPTARRLRRMPSASRFRRRA